jgi:O-antigen/teichoic acid export membrane protein
MNTVQRIAKNMTVLLLARIVSMLFGFFYVMYTARYLGPASFGILSFALALTGIFGVITNFGLDPLTVREVARDKNLAGKYLANGIVLKLLFGTLTFLIVFAVINLLGYPKITRKVVYIITLSTTVAGVNNLFNDIYQAFERMEFMSVGQILQSVLSLIFAITAIKLGLNVVYFAMIYLVANLVGMGYHISVTTWKFLKPEIEVDLSFWKNVVREAWPFALTAVFVSIYYWIDSIMLSYMKGDEVVGWYNASYRIIFVLMIISSLYITTIFPIMSRLFKFSEEHLDYIYKRSIKYMLLIGIPIVIGVTLLADRIILLTFGSEYAPSIAILQVLIWSFLFASIGGVSGYLLNSINKQTTLTKIVGCGMVINVVLNIFLIPNYSYIGAGIATDLTRFFVILVEFIILSKIGFNLKDRVFLDGALKITISSLILAYFIESFKNSNLLLLIILSALLYFTTLYLIKGLDKEDISLMKKVVSWQK